MEINARNPDTINNNMFYLDLTFIQQGKSVKNKQILIYNNGQTLP